MLFVPKSINSRNLDEYIEIILVVQYQSLQYLQKQETDTHKGIFLNVMTCPVLQYGPLCVICDTLGVHLD